MNRLVLIGNGFDLAHGLKTSYEDFLNWYWWQKLSIAATKRLNQQAKRNIARFPESFRFELTKEEVGEVVANCDMSRSKRT